MKYKILYIPTGEFLVVDTEGFGKLCIPSEISSLELGSLKFKEYILNLKYEASLHLFYRFTDKNKDTMLNWNNFVHSNNKLINSEFELVRIIEHEVSL